MAESFERGSHFSVEPDRKNAEGDPQALLLAAPVINLWSSLGAKVYTDPTGGDVRFSYYGDGGPRAAASDPLREFSAGAVMAEIVRRAEQLSNDEIQTGMTQLRSMIESKMIGPSYSTGMLNIAFALGRSQSDLDRQRTEQSKK